MKDDNIGLIQKCRVGILVTHHPITLINELYDFGELMDSSVTLDLIAGYETPELLNRYYNIHRFQYPIKHKFFEYVAEFIACSRYARKYKPDALIQFSNPHRAGLINSIVGRIFGVKAIVEMTGESFLVWKIQESLLKKVEWFCGMCLSKIAFLLASKIVTYGPILKSHMVSQGIKPEKIFLLPPALSLNRFKLSIDKSSFKQELGISPTDKVALYVGRLHRPKGTDRLLTIIETVLTKTKKWTFLIIGTGDFYKKLKEIGSPKVKLFGEVSPLDIDIFYKASDLLVFPSRTEGLSRVVLEALASGIPVISSGVGEIPSYVSNICNSIEDYVEYILKENYRLDNIPEVYLNDHWKQMCLELLSNKK